jgi:catechol 2,3-dioxygenase-like lactoylglutathione lyase family enzyme
MEMKLERPIPVADVDRAKTFYVERLGFVEDVDAQPAYDEMAPGTIKGMHLVVPTSSRPALIWSAAALRSAPSRTWAEESSTHGWPTPTATP